MCYYHEPLSLYTSHTLTTPRASNMQHYISSYCDITFVMFRLRTLMESMPLICRSWSIVHCDRLTKEDNP